MKYEDKWQLNDGSKEIPKDAETLKHNGSVVAYRLPIYEIEVGDKVRSEIGSSQTREVISIHNGYVWCMPCNGGRVPVTFSKKHLTLVQKGD